MFDSLTFELLKLETARVSQFPYVIIICSPNSDSENILFCSEATLKRVGDLPKLKRQNNLLSSAE